jgi:hypothetical protein
VVNKSRVLYIGCLFCVSAAFAGDPGGGRLPIIELPLDALARYRACGWGDTRYGGFPSYYYDTPTGNFRVWYVLAGPNALADQLDRDRNGFPDMVEWIGTHFEWSYYKTKEDNWFYHPDPREAVYLPLRDYYPTLGWPEEGQDYGGSDRWDVYCGDLPGGVLGITYPFGPFPKSARDCYSAYFNVDNEYDEEYSPLIAARLWGTAVTYMFDAAETSETPIPRWLTAATGPWIMERVYKPKAPDAPGRQFFQSLFNDTLAPLTQNGTPFLYFLEDWSKRYWVAPAWRPRPPADGPLVRYVWRATSKGDAWYTGEAGLDRSTEEAVTCVIEDHDRSKAFAEGRAFKDAFELFTLWNWFAGDRDDGLHYRYGARYPTLNPQNRWVDYPIVGYEPGPRYLMNNLGAGYYLFESPPPWGAALFTVEAAAGNKPASKDWGGWVAVTKNGTTWTDLDGRAGAASPLFSPGDKCIARIKNPGRYQAVLAVVNCPAYEGAQLNFKYSFVSTEDGRPPAAAAAIVRPEANPDSLEILLGGDEKLFGAEADVVFEKQGETKLSRKTLELAPGRPGLSFVGTYGMDGGASGRGILNWRVADEAGNIASGEKEFGAGFLSSSGGTVGGDKAFLRLPAGVVAQPTLFSIVPVGEEKGAAAAAARAAAAGDEKPAVETVGPSYEYGPTWARLAGPFEVALSYEGLEVAREDYLSVYRWTGSSWEDLGGTIDKRNRRVSAVGDRLGTFVLGYGEKKDTTPPAGKPMSFGLFQNYPNPARDGTVIKFALPERTEVELAVYDLSGRRVATMVKESRGAGVHEERYTLTDDGGKPLPAGVYLYRLTAGSDVAARKMVVVR